MKRAILLAFLFLAFLPFGTVLGFKASTAFAQEKMLYGDTTRVGVPFSKDPHVIHFKGRYLMYYSIPPYNWNDARGWNIGIAESKDLVHWTHVGEITPEKGCDYEQKGLCAPCAIVVKGKVHLFYQTYGNAAKDAICHAVSKDGLKFKRDKTNPIFHPEVSDWSCGRAIDAEVAFFKGKYYMYFATRDPEFKIQKLGVAVADGNTDFSRKAWKLAADKSILWPYLPWEGVCIEAPSVLVRDSLMYLFYAGAYNNAPQQISYATSTDGVNFVRQGPAPFKRNGLEGEWNHSESGHPHLFKDDDGKTYLFYQGNNDNGKTWKLTQEEVKWDTLKSGKERPWLQSEKDRRKSEKGLIEDYDLTPHNVGGTGRDWHKFILDNINWPDPEFKGKGKVIVSFLVDLDGTKSDYKIEKSMAPKFDEEALRIAKLIPVKPGKNQYRPARYYINIPFVKKEQ